MPFLNSPQDAAEHEIGRWSRNNTTKAAKRLTISLHNIGIRSNYHMGLELKAATNEQSPKNRSIMGGYYTTP